MNQNLDAFARIFDRCLELNGAMAWHSNSPIHGWLDAGADPDKDILPTIERLFKNKPDISSFKYFTNAILKAKQDREEAERAISKEVPIRAPVDDLKKAKIIKWFKEKKVFTTRFGIQDYQWLENYEKQFGEVAI